MTEHELFNSSFVQTITFDIFACPDCLWDVRRVEVIGNDNCTCDCCGRIFDKESELIIRNLVPEGCLLVSDGELLSCGDILSRVL